ncbi:MAG: hypothetical protein QOF83_2392 [Solirubrobacteraceae bacterium]|jgi:hypothetical protein|nr:hypothetical protein [Solirubrobacteraceae bacterium]
MSPAARDGPHWPLERRRHRDAAVMLPMSYELIGRDYMFHEPIPDSTSELPETRAAVCPGCTLPILFDPLELEADDPALHELMCAWCGTVTSRWLLISQVYDSSGASALPPRG